MNPPPPHKPVTSNSSGVNSSGPKGSTSLILPASIFKILC
uniref:Uncharacterized protein n=1 Tax=Arundo donax TaxID=35708 RepID=A0A0A9EP19_ARUDO